MVFVVNAQGHNLRNKFDLIWENDNLPDILLLKHVAYSCIWISDFRIVIRPKSIQHVFAWESEINLGGHWDIKLLIFGSEGTENFENLRVCKEKSSIFWSFDGKFCQILNNIVIMDYFGRRNKSFFDLKEVEKISGNFLEKIARHKTPNFKSFRKFVNKNAMIRGWLGDIKLQKIGGPPKLISDKNP